MSIDSLCVSGDTLILTDCGYFSMKELNGKSVNAWNGSEYSLTNIYKSATPQPLYLVVTSDGCKIKCTSFHSFFILSDVNKDYFYKKKVNELKLNDIIVPCKYPIINGDTSKDFIDPYTMGLLTIGGDVYDVPINSSLNNKLYWLAGFIDGNGELVHKNGMLEIKINYIFKDFLYNIKLLCNTLQLNPRINVVSSSLVELVSRLNGKITYSLTFNPYETDLLLNQLALPLQKIKRQLFSIRSDYKYEIKIQAINKLNITEDVYNFIEPKRGMGVLNGVLSGK